MDGNGRWAKARGKERIYGHFEGVESVRACTEACVEEGVKYLSLCLFGGELEKAGRGSRGTYVADGQMYGE